LARLASLVATCKLNDVEPFAYMKITLEALAAGHRNAEIDLLLTWNFQAPPRTAAAALQTMFSSAPRKRLASITNQMWPGRRYLVLHIDPGAGVRGGLGTIVGATFLGMGIACLETPTFKDLE
jgi:hypothetical protein